MMYYLKLYAATFVGFLAIDIVWLAFVARGFYKQPVGLPAQRPAQLVGSDRLLLALHCWAARVRRCPRLQAGSLRKALLLGAFFGLVTYATYDLTNQATVKNWPWIVTVVDMAWGTVLAASVRPRIPGRTLATVTSGGGQHEYLTRLLWLPIIPQFSGVYAPHSKGVDCTQCPEKSS